MSDKEWRCPRCGKPTSGSWSEGGLKWAICDECMGADRRDPPGPGDSEDRDDLEDYRGDEDEPEPEEDDPQDIYRALYRFGRDCLFPVGPSQGGLFR